MAKDDPVLPQTGAKERRGHPRKKVLRSAKVSLHGDTSIYDCQVWDISDKGAKIRFPAVTPVPKQFKLWISDGGLYLCEVRRIDSNWIGVEFVDVLPQSEAVKIFGRVF